MFRKADEVEEGLAGQCDGVAIVHERHRCHQVPTGLESGVHAVASFDPCPTFPRPFRVPIRGANNTQTTINNPHHGQSYPSGPFFTLEGASAARAGRRLGTDGLVAVVQVCRAYHSYL